MARKGSRKGRSAKAKALKMSMGRERGRSMRRERTQRRERERTQRRQRTQRRT